MKTYVETLEESIEDLSRRLAVAEKYIAWKDSHKRLKFKYVLMYHNEVNGHSAWVGKHIVRSKMHEYLFMFKTLGKNVLIELIEKTYSANIDTLQLKLKAFHGLERMIENPLSNQQVSGYPVSTYKSIVHISK